MPALFRGGSWCRVALWIAVIVAVLASLVAFTTPTMIVIIQEGMTSATSSDKEKDADEQPAPSAIKEVTAKEQVEKELKKNTPPDAISVRPLAAAEDDGFAKPTGIGGGGPGEDGISVAGASANKTEGFESMNSSNSISTFSDPFSPAWMSPASIGSGVPPRRA